MDPNQATYTKIPLLSMMPINSQWPGSNAMTATAGNVASTSGMGISNCIEMISPANAFSSVNMGSNNASLYGMVPNMQERSFPFPVINYVNSTVPIFNNLEPITIPGAVLTPPLPGEKRSYRPKPPGCKTVIVLYLPEKITEEILNDAFQICGPISAIRMNKRKLCHIRFVNTESADQARLLSGFRIKIAESEDSAYNSRLFVDYSVALDDQRDYECLMRAKYHEERQRMKEALRPPSPPQIPHFAEHEAQNLAERLHNKETFIEDLQVLITWLDRGECNERNSGTFYSLIQISYSHVPRLRNEKIRYEGIETDKLNLLHKNCEISRDIIEINKVFIAVETQKVWDHFTKSQRKEVEKMKYDAYDLMQSNSKDLVCYRVEIDASDYEDF